MVYVHVLCMHACACTYAVYMCLIYVPALCMTAYTYEYMTCVCVYVYGHEADVPHIVSAVFMYACVRNWCVCLMYLHYTYCARRSSGACTPLVQHTW